MENMRTTGPGSASCKNVQPNKQDNCHTLSESPVKEELASLESWCDNVPADNSEYLYNAKKFYQFFSSELYAARNAYERNKKQTWDKKAIFSTASATS